MSSKTVLWRTFIQKNKFSNITSIAVRGKYERHYEENNFKGKFKYGKGAAAALLGSVLIGTNITEHLEHKHRLKTNKLSLVKVDADQNNFEAGLKRPDLPTYTAEEVRKHDSKESFWVTYKHGVYDITSFLPSHPGGEQIYNAAGLSIEPFWNVYGMHKTPEIFKLLEQHRIGNLQDSDVLEHSDADFWVNEPLRDRRLIVKTQRPFNAEIPPQYQIMHFDTPNELFFVRQHMPVPELDAKQHSLTITVKDKGQSVVCRLNLDELNQFPRTEVRAALMCAGNRRSEMSEQTRPVKGISWGGGAVSNAVWGGVLLRDVLLQAGVSPTPADLLGKHIIFQGSDIDVTGVNFSASIPLYMAMNPNAHILLATHMNGEELPKDHGYPLRVIVPGAPAVRSVKWLESITISEDESPSHWHQKDYRAFNPSKTWETADFPSAPPVYSLPVTSAICYPLNGDTVKVKDGYIEVSGYAYSGGGARIFRVDVTGNKGETWEEAELKTDDAPPQVHYSWTLWKVKVPVVKGQTEVELWAKATDSNFNTQPERFNDIWNIRGILSNAYHKIKIRVQQ